MKAENSAPPPAPAPAPTRRKRGSKPAQSLRTREQIVDAVITVLSEAGIGGLTHRRVAEAAGVSLSATTYHYASKQTMLDDASNRLLASYLDALRAQAERFRSGGPRHTDLGAFITTYLAQAAGRHRRTSLAWCEIILDAARTPEGHALALRWFTQLAEVWSDLAGATGLQPAPHQVQIAIDTTIGFLFIILSLGLNEEDVHALRGDPTTVLRGDESRGALDDEADRSPASPKAERTRATILGATIAILKEQGPAGVSYRAVSERAGVSLTAPAYHCGSIRDLIRLAERDLFQASKQRYREMLAAAKAGGGSPDDLADVTTTILIREATAHRSASIAHYAIWLESARTAALRPEVQGAILDQAQAWQRRLAPLGATTLSDGLTFQALFIGQLVRTLASGGELAVMSGLRAAFRAALDARLSLAD